MRNFKVFKQLMRKLRRKEAFSEHNLLTRISRICTDLNPYKNEFHQNSIKNSIIFTFKIVLEIFFKLILVVS